MKKKVKNKETTTKAAPSSSVGLMLCALVSTLAIALYAWTLGFDYALDDVAVITQNRFTRMGLAGIPHLLTTFYWQGFWDTNAGLYRPLSLVSFALDWQLAPGRAGFGHAVNVALYGVTAWQLLRLLDEWLPRQRAVALLTTLLFVVHPLHVEAVANIKSRDELLCFLFFVLSARSLLRSGIHTAGWRTSALFGLCLLSKESGLMLLAALAVACVWFQGQSLSLVSRRLWPLALVAIAFLAAHQTVIRSAPSPPISYTYQDNALVRAPDLVAQKATALSLVGRGLALTLWPHDLSYDYSFNAVPIVGLTNPQVWLALALLIALGAVAVRGARARTTEAFGVLFLFLSWATSANLLFLVGTTFGERLLYAPLLGVMLALATAAQRYLPRLHPRAFIGASVVSLAMFTSASAVRIPNWKDDWTLYTTGPATQPGSARVQYNAGTAHLRLHALASPPSPERGAALAQAASHLQEAVRIDPSYADALLNLAVTRYQLGQYPEALDLGRAAYTRAPQLGAAHAVAGSALFRMQRFAESVQENRAALAQGYVADDTWNFVGAALLQTGDYAGAVEAFTRASERVPQDQEIRRNLDLAQRLSVGLP